MDSGTLLAQLDAVSLLLETYRDRRLAAPRDGCRVMTCCSALVGFAIRYLAPTRRAVKIEHAYQQLQFVADLIDWHFGPPPRPIDTSLRHIESAMDALEHAMTDLRSAEGLSELGETGTVVIAGSRR